jgi:hypothetical protein
MVKLLTSDGQEFVVEKELADKSTLLKNMIADIGESGKGE